MPGQFDCFHIRARLPLAACERQGIQSLGAAELPPRLFTDVQFPFAPPKEPAVRCYPLYAVQSAALEGQAGGVYDGQSPLVGHRPGVVDGLAWRRGVGVGRAVVIRINRQGGAYQFVSAEQLP